MTILNSVDIIETFELFKFILLCCGVILGIALCIILAFVCDDFDSLGGFCFGLAICCAIGGCIEIFEHKGYKYTKIECTIDETVPANELLDKYEVLDHRGEIYVLKYIDEEKLMGND